MNGFTRSFLELKSYCEHEKFKGWDPYDGLNSKLFQATPLRRSSLARLILIQTMKRSPVNLRPLLRVPKEHNPKALGLFLTGYCNLYEMLREDPDFFGGEITASHCEEMIQKVSGILLEKVSSGYSGACWGYNFDWQARKILYFPKYTPTVVVTAFVVQALFQAYGITQDRKLLSTALSSADFVMNDLKRTYKERGFLFSYSPLEGNNTVYNASLLGSKLLAMCYHYTGNEEYLKASGESVRACIDAQEEDGSWVYGEHPVQNWRDSFHTGYNLEALLFYQRYTGDDSYSENIQRGLSYYLNTFFLPDGTPKYYHDRIYPVDIHCPAQLPVTVFHAGLYDEYKDLVDRVLSWTIEHMQDKKGYFYFQLKKGISSKIPYMRWSQAFMFYAFSYYFKSVSSLHPQVNETSTTERH